MTVAAITAVATACSHHSSARIARIDGLTVSFSKRFDHGYFVGSIRGRPLRGLALADYRLAPDLHFGSIASPNPERDIEFELYATPTETGLRAPVLVLPMIRLSEFRKVAHNPAPVRPVGVQKELFFRIGRTNYWAVARIGRRAAAADKTDLERLVSSIQLSRGYHGAAAANR